MSPYLCSILVPTRKRAFKLAQFIDRLATVTRNRDRIELIFGVDSDDAETIEFFQNITASPLNIRYIVEDRPPRKYQDLHLIYNNLYCSAQGEFICVFNDDAIVVTQGWDDVLHTYSGTHKIIKANVIVENVRIAEGMIFPIISKTVVDIVGSVGMHSSLDVQWEIMAEYLPEMFVSEPQLHMLHEYELGLPLSDHDPFDPGSVSRLRSEIQADAQKVRSALL